MNKNFRVGKLNFSENSRPIVVAEMSANHNHSLKRAKKIIKLAANTGVDMIKFQTYKPETMTLKSSNSYFKIKDKKSIWKDKNLYELYKKAYTPWEWHEDLFREAYKNKVIPFSTPFDLSSLEFLENLKCKLYKVASFEITDLPLLANIAKTKKPMIISTGMATQKEIFDAVKTIVKNGCNKFILLKCTSNYPASPSSSNLKTITDLKKKFKCNVGLSDHTLGIGAAITSVAYGSMLIEKHFTIKRSDGGVDSKFSLEPSEMKQLVEEIRSSWQAQGKISYGPSKEEMKNLKFRRSIYFFKDIKKGKKILNEDLKILRPALGIEPKNIKKLIKFKAKKNIKKGTPVKWNLLEKI